MRRRTSTRGSVPTYVCLNVSETAKNSGEDLENIVHVLIQNECDYETLKRLCLPARQFVLLILFSQAVKSRSLGWKGFTMLVFNSLALVSTWM